MVMRHIAVGYDGSRASEYAVGWALREAAARNTILVVVSACPSPRHPARITSERRVAVLAQVFSLQNKAIIRAAEALAAGQRRPVVGREVSVADPVDALYRAATRADLLVLGSDRDEGPTAGSVAGRIAARLSAHRRKRSPCPLIVIATPRVGATAINVPTVKLPAFDAALDVAAADGPLIRRIGRVRPAAAGASAGGQSDPDRGRGSGALGVFPERHRRCPVDAPCPVPGVPGSSRVAMSTIRRTTAAGLAGLALVFGVLAGCGRAAPTAGTPSPSTSSPAGTVTTSPAPATKPATPPPADATTAPGDTVVLSRVAYPWHWPNDDSHQGGATHTYQVPPVPQLIRIGARDHPSDPGERPFNRMSFTFTTAFPSYRIEFVDGLIGDGNGQTVPLGGLGVLKVTFRQAQGHTEDGTSSIVSRPPEHLGYNRMVGYAQGGDFEGVLSYGIGITWPVPESNPQIAVRAYEVEQVTGEGRHLYVVAIDIDATQPR